MTVRLLKERVVELRRHVRPAAKHDVDGVHDLRVASRRIRAVLTDHAPLVEKSRLRPFRKRMRSVTRGLGKARELDVTLGLLATIRRQRAGPERAAALYAARYLRGLRNDESPLVDAGVALVRDVDFRSELNDLIDAVRAPKSCYLVFAGDALRARTNDLECAYSRWKNLHSEEHLHQIRLAFKKFRYSCEIVERLFGPSMGELIAQIKELQDALGAWNDHRVLRSYLEACEPHATPKAAQGLPSLRQFVAERTNRLYEEAVAAIHPFFERELQDRIRVLFDTPAHRCCNPATRARTMNRAGGPGQM
jgi:CHAD domain-containing protein